MSDALVLCYHTISRTLPADFNVKPQDLERQLSGLVRRGYRGATFREAVLEAPRGRVLAVTFDDACRSVLDEALPIMRRLGLPGTVFPVVDLVGREEPLCWPGIEEWRGGPHERELCGLGWDGLGELVEAGWEVGSHTCSHPWLPDCDERRLDDELRRSREVLEWRLGRACESIAYPYGGVDARVLSAARAAGYRAGGALGSLRAGDSLDHPRVGVYSKDTGLRLRVKAAPTVRLLRAAAARGHGWPQPLPGWRREREPASVAARDGFARDPQRPVRVLAYTDQRYWRRGEDVYAQRSFVTFMGAVGERVAALTVLGRASDGPGEAHYLLPRAAAFRALPWYDSAADPLALARAATGTLRTFWRALDEADVCWLLGPSPFAIAFAALAALRRRRVVLGVRQDLRAYARSRHPGRRPHRWAADVQELAFRGLARRMAVVTVGEELAEGYRRSPALLALPVSLVRASSVVERSAALARDFDGDELRLLTVSRLDEEKNPLLLADVLAELLRADGRWRLLIAGEGPCEGDLRARLAELGVSDRAVLLGHVDLEPGLLELYRSSHAFLHVSWTEGLPQVLFEAFAAGLPVVATAVGGVAAAARDAALLVRPGDAAAAARELERIAGDRRLRERLAERALARASETTLEATSERLAAFLADPYADSSR